MLFHFRKTQNETYGGRGQHNKSEQSRGHGHEVSEVAQLPRGVVMRLCVRSPFCLMRHETHPLKVRSSFLQLNKGFKQRQRRQQQHCSGCSVICETHQVLIEAILSSKCTGLCSSQETGSQAQERYATVSSQVIRDVEFFPQHS